jgi:hypothetical protein
VVGIGDDRGDVERRESGSISLPSFKGNSTGDRHSLSEANLAHESVVVHRRRIKE